MVHSLLSHCLKTCSGILLLSVASRTVVSEPQRLIIDTDMSSDCDDVGAVCLAHALMDAGEADLLAVVHNTGLLEGVGAVSALNAWYGRDSLPVGAYKGYFDATWPSSYVADVVNHSEATVCLSLPLSLSLFLSLFLSREFLY